MFESSTKTVLEWLVEVIPFTEINYQISSLYNIYIFIQIHEVVTVEQNT